MQQQQQRPQPEQQSLSISTFNILAPCYKRMQDGGREADFPEYMERRAIDTATFIRCVKMIQRTFVAWAFLFTPFPLYSSPILNLFLPPSQGRAGHGHHLPPRVFHA